MREGPRAWIAPAATLSGPAVLLWNPKYAHNVGAVVRSASCYGVPAVWMFGSRVEITAHDKSDRLPREERMRGYADVRLHKADRPFDLVVNACLVAVEFRENAESLPDFIHPANPVYVFGPEDGHLPNVALRHCRRFVCIPTKHCLNLSVAVATVLYDRAAKAGRP